MDKDKDKDNDKEKDKDKDEDKDKDKTYIYPPPKGDLSLFPPQGGERKKAPSGEGTDSASG